MQLVINGLILLVALEHFYFLVLEMFLWNKPLGLKVFNQSKEKADASKVLAANQGLYNGFLAVGLLWSFAQSDPVFSLQLARFFLGCVIAAGIFGALTVNRRIFFVQALPALLAECLLALK